MRTWRDRGYVPDSDEEEGGGDDSQPRFRTTASKESLARAGSDGHQNNDTWSRHGAPDSEKENRLAELPVQTIDRSSQRDIGFRAVARPLRTYGSRRARARRQASMVEKTDFVIPGDDTLNSDTITGSRHHWSSQETRHTSSGLQRASSGIETDGLSELGSTPVRIEARQSENGQIDEMQSPPSSLVQDIGGQASHTMIGQIAMHGIDASPLEPTRQHSSEHTYQPERSFRPRKAIQMHPYMIESEQYRQSWKARGLVPLRVAVPGIGEQVIQMTEPRMPETQEEFSTGLQEDSFLMQSSSGLSELTWSDQDDGLPIQTQPFEINEDADLPDVQSLLQRRTGKAVQLGAKRRKLDRLHAVSANAHDHSGVDATETLSPASTAPNSPRDDAHLQRPTFKYPALANPRGLLTPDTSSSAGHLTGSVSYRTSPRPIGIRIDAEDAESAELQETYPTSSDTDVEPQIERQRKRIRGVLPASWLRLDSKAQRQHSPAKTREDDLRTPGVPGTIRGIAQPRAGRHSTAVDQGHYTSTGHVDLSDGFSELGETSPSSPLPTHAISTHGSRRKTARRKSRIHSGDEMEDNRIDAMLLPGPRIQRSRDVQRKRQTKLPLSFRRSSRMENGLDASNHPRTPRAERPGKQQRRARRAQPLSILDARQQDDGAQRRQPQFVRVAQRQARRHQNGGRQSPSKKTIRLATLDDTRDALTTLEAWHAGAIVSQAGSAMSRHRHPAVETTSAAPRQNRQEADHIDQMPWRQRDECPNLPRIGSRLQQSTLRPLLSRPKAGPATRDAVPALPSRLRSTVLDRQSYRNGQLETVGPRLEGAASTHIAQSRRIALQHLLRGRPEHLSDYRLPLRRFLQEDDVSPTPIQCEVETEGAREAQQPREQVPPAVRSRKSVAARLDVGTKHYRQPDEPLPSPDSVVESETNTIVINERVMQGLQGLGPFGTRYAIDFDIRPLELGTYFNQDSFIGSGDFASLLTFRNRDLDEPAGQISIDDGTKTERWSVWNEEVSSALNRVLSTCQQGIVAISEAVFHPGDQDKLRGAKLSTIYLMRSLTRYISGCLRFSDPIDRSPCLKQFHRFVTGVLDILSEHLTNLVGSEGLACTARDAFTEVLFYLFCLNAGATKASQHPSTPEELASALMAQHRAVLQKLISLNIPGGCESIRTIYEELRKNQKRSAGLNDDDSVAARSLVVAYHVTSTVTDPSFFHSALADALGNRAAHTFHVGILDRAWYDLLTIQPLLEVDATGIFRPRSRYHTTNDNWALVKTMLDRILSLYAVSVSEENPSVNDYVRHTFMRVYVLVTRWQWKHCDLALTTLYDFFAKRGLANLIGENVHGLPLFLEQLHTMPSLSAEAHDPSFHLFLKILAAALGNMVSFYPAAKMKRLAWRFVPNHGRTYRKDEDARQEDIDALRNHHSLLVTLYWTLPQGSRPKLTLVKDLVDFAQSHQEACRVSIQAWQALARHILSTDEPDAEVSSLAAWHQEMTSSMSVQYRLARSEAEEMFEHSRSNGVGTLSYDTVQMTVGANQARIMQTMVAAVAAMQEGVKVAKDVGRVHTQLRESQVTDALKLFDGTQPRTHAITSAVLAVIQQCLDNEQSRTAVPTEQTMNESEESQDYGDLDVFDMLVHDEDAINLPAPAKDTLFFQPAVTQFVSSAFGSDGLIDDGLLARAADVWVSIAQRTISDGIKTWTQYLDTHSSDSWLQLRRTVNVRKWTCYVLSAILSKDPSSYEENKQVILQTWLGSLMERDSMLKFQGRLTAELLNIDAGKDLLDNLPFASDKHTGIFTISISDIRARRLNLIGTVLWNMRKTLDRSTHVNNNAAAEARREYKDLLRYMMTTMKACYQELQGDDKTLADPSTKGTYVGFVQHVVSLMQEHTVEICAVDSFFTDSSAFPLPSKDPAYVVGRLRSYVPKLGDSRGRKQLAVFIQTLCVRAAVDHTQQALVDQLTAALSDSAKVSGVNNPPLRDVLCTAILPAYIEAALRSATGSIIALPLLQASGSLLAGLLYDMNLSDHGDSSGILTIVVAVISTISKHAGHLLSTGYGGMPALMSQSLSTIFAMVAPILTVVEYFHRAARPSLEARHAAEMLSDLSRTAQRIKRRIRGTAEEDYLPDTITTLTDASLWKDTLDFTGRELLEEVSKHWTQEQGRVYVVRGNNKQEIAAVVGTPKDERVELLRAIEAYSGAYGKVFGLMDSVHSDDHVDAGLGDIFI